MELLFSSIKTFYDADLDTTNFFENQANNLDLCDVLGRFRETRSGILTPMPKCIRFKESQLLYCHGEENYRNFSK